MPTFQTFQDAIAAETDVRKRHALLGNGFSIACKPDIFTYGALFDRADFQAVDQACRNAFDALGTRSFEVVMEAMRTAAKLAPLYVHDRHISEKLLGHAESLKTILAAAIAQSHPEHPFEIDEDAYSHARTFLGNFGSIYTLSYDLLLYWALMREEIPPEIDCDDGFRRSDDGAAAYVTWEVENTTKQNVHFFHGALHLFDAGHELKKFTWSGTQIHLIDQIREALDRGLFPLIVTEGDTNGKLRAINHHNYLARVYRSFASISNTLYVYGFAFSRNDEHILRLLEKNRVARLFVSVYGPPDSEENRRIIARVEVLANSRPQKRPMEVYFFDAGDAHVWG